MAETVQGATRATAAIVKPCKCEHEFQDKRYHGQRVWNLAEDEAGKTKKGIKRYRCTVCCNTKEF